MNQVAELNLAQTQRREVRGRKDKQGQEKVIEMSALRDRLDDLIAMFKDKQLATEAFGESVKDAAEASGLLASTVRKYVAARASDNLSEKRTEAEQLVLVFEELAGS